MSQLGHIIRWRNCRILLQSQNRVYKPICHWKLQLGGMNLKCWLKYQNLKFKPTCIIYIVPLSCLVALVTLLDKFNQLICHWFTRRDMNTRGWLVGCRHVVLMRGAGWTVVIWLVRSGCASRPGKTVPQWSVRSLQTTACYLNLHIPG